MILPGNKQTYYSPIAIDFGNSHIKMIQLHRSNKRPSLWQQAICPTPAGSIVDGNIVEPELIARQLQNISRSTPWKGKQVNCSLLSQAAHTTIVTLPEMSARQINQAMHLQAEMLFPVAVNAVEISYCELNFADQDHCNDPQNSITGQYLLTAVRKETLKIYRSIIEEAGFSLHSFETPVCSLVRSISQAGEMSSPANRNAAERIIIDFGCKTTTVLIINRCGSVKFQIIAIGCNDFLQVIMHKWPFLIDKAEQALFSAGSLSDKGLLPLTQQLTYAIRNIVSHRAGPVNASTITACPNSTVCGGGIYIPGLASHLQNELSMRLSVYNPLQYLGAEIDKQGRQQLNKASLFATAHGLAIRH
ncbi:MAG: pilus assembly protein PilM [Dethiobacteria bacterium]|nr:pilus assembly protein PilM [Dethiobacteria bacterium]